MNEPRTIDTRSGWLGAAELQALLAALSADGEEARVAGGAVRNALLGEAVADVDIATTCLPDDTITRAIAAGFKTVRWQGVDDNGQPASSGLYFILMKAGRHQFVHKVILQR